MRLVTADPRSRFRLLAKWGSGGMADVYVARQIGAGGFDKIVALKFLREQGDSPAIREMFLDEVRTAALLNHPGIVQTFDAGELDDRLYMAMEFVNGETLGRFRRAVVRGGGAFSTPLALAIARDLANALEYAHTLTDLDGVPLELVHRDVSPSNVLVSFDGMVKLLDFGVAKVATKLQMTGAGVIKGKFSYMPPEQARGEEIDQRADVYSLGIVLWQLLTGRPAFQADSDLQLLRLVMAPVLAAPSVAGAECPDEVDAIVMAAVAPDPADRYQTAGDLATALSRYLTRRAAGFDATKVIRGLMAAHFQDRRDRLARLVASDRDLPLDDADRLGDQPPSPPPLPLPLPLPPPLDPVASATVKTLDELAMPVTVVPTIARSPGWRHRWQVVALITAVLVGASYAMVREPMPPSVVDARAPAPAPQPEPPVAQPAAAVAPAPAPPEVEPSPELVEDAAPEAPPPPETDPAPPTRRNAGKRRGSRGGRSSAAPSRDAGSAAAGSEPTAVVTVDPLPAEADDEPADAPSDPAPADAPEAKVPATSDRRPRREAAPGALDAAPRIRRVSVDGSLPTSEIKDAMGRTTAALRACYRSAARRANTTPALSIKVAFVIDEARAARGVQVTGDTLGVAGCVRDALANLRTRVAPDVGTVAVTAVIKFEPAGD
jgi:serine/threonine-protein kinase